MRWESPQRQRAARNGLWVIKRIGQAPGETSAWFWLWWPSKERCIETRVSQSQPLSSHSACLCLASGGTRVPQKLSTSPWRSGELFRSQKRTRPLPSGASPTVHNGRQLWGPGVLAPSQMRVHRGYRAVLRRAFMLHLLWHQRIVKRGKSTKSKYTRIMDKIARFFACMHRYTSHLFWDS